MLFPEVRPPLSCTQWKVTGLAEAVGLVLPFCTQGTLAVCRVCALPGTALGLLAEDY